VLVLFSRRLIAFLFFIVIQIDWENRYLQDNGSVCKTSVDGTDFRIYEPSPFDPQWYSHKFKGPGVRYEIGLNIQTGDIVWTNGPFACGAYSDRKIAKEEGLEYCLADGEKYIADAGYRGGRAVTPNGQNDNEQWMQSKVRARHETLNRRLKQFGVLEQTFRHDRSKHRAVFSAIANLTQITLREESPLFQVEYIDI
jgi:hypothetical protein